LNTETPPSAEVETSSQDSLPKLGRDSAFWGMTLTQFLGAFNDNLFKQLILLLALPTVAVSSSVGNQEADKQWIASLVFAIPFLLFSSFAGYISEVRSKRSVIVLCKVGEIVIMAIGVLAFAFYAQWGLVGLLVVLFLMGAQSAFFGPGKYGILPEMLRPNDLGKANGIILMTTFLAIILGTAIAGFLKHLLNTQLYLAASVCVAIGVFGTLASLLVRKTPPADPNLKLDFEAITAPQDVRKLLRSDGKLAMAIFASCMFWMVGGVVHPAVNALGKRQLLIGNKQVDIWTSLLAASVGVGIATGCLLAGYLSRAQVNFRLVRIGMWGICVCLFLIWLPGKGDFNLMEYWGSMACLICLGIFTGMFVVPLQVFIQSRPPEGIKGRIIATTNLFNWVAILGAAILYLGFSQLLAWQNWQSSTLFGFTALLFLPMAIFYRPQNETLEAAPLE